MGLLCQPMALHSQHVTPQPRVMPDGSLSNPEDYPDDPMCVPLASPFPGFEQQPQQGATSLPPPPRCQSCNAYVSSFWEDHCNFCGTRGPPPTPVGNIKGTMEYAVDGPYITRATPVAPHYVYALDASCPHLKDYVELIAQVGVSLATSPQASQARIGIVLVSPFGIYMTQCCYNDGNLGFVVMSDVTEDPHCPLPVEEFTFSVSTQLEEWKSFTANLLENWEPFIKQLDKRTPYNTMGHASSCGGAALAFLSYALAERGGRGTWLSWRRPNFGCGQIRDRERCHMPLYKKEETERTLYLPLQCLAKAKLSDKLDEDAAAFYKKIGDDCAKNRVAIDIILHTQPKPIALLDIGTLSHICRISCGKLKWIWTSAYWKEQMGQELLRPVLAFHGTDAIFKVRCSTGLQVKRFVGTAPGVTIENSLVGDPELELTVVGQDTCIAVELEHRIGGLPKKENTCFVQSALLYTTVTGQRRVRVSTLALKVANSAADVYRGSDFGALTAFFTQQAIAHIWDQRNEESPVEDARKELTSKTTKILAGYRLNTNALNLPEGQLILPDKLQLLPLFCMALLKSAILRPSFPKRGSGIRATHPNPHADDRAYALFHGSTVNPAVAMLMVHPNIFSVSNLTDGAGEWQVPEMDGRPKSQLAQIAHHAYVQLPPSVQPSIACIQDDQVYLIDDGMNIFIYFGQDVKADVRSELLEVTKFGRKLSTSSDFGQQVERLVWQMRTFSSIGPGSEAPALRPSTAPVIVVQYQSTRKDAFEGKVMNLMVDDQIGGEQDYVDFLVECHKLVRGMVSKGSID